MPYNFVVGLGKIISANENYVTVGQKQGRSLKFDSEMGLELPRCYLTTHKYFTFKLEI